MQEKTGWLGSKKNASIAFHGVWILSGLFLAEELLVHLHPYFDAEDQFGFYALFGFAACMAVILGALVLRTLAGRSEDYYDE